MWTLARRHCALSTRQMTTVKGPQFIEQFQKFEISIAKKINDDALIRTKITKDASEKSAGYVLLGLGMLYGGGFYYMNNRVEIRDMPVKYDYVYR